MTTQADSSSLDGDLKWDVQSQWKFSMCSDEVRQENLRWNVKLHDSQVIKCKTFNNTADWEMTTS